MSRKKIFGAVGAETSIVMALVAFSLAAMIISNSLQKPAPLEVTPSNVEYNLPDEERNKLNPSVRELLSDVENGTASGAIASTYADSFALAEKVTHRGSTTTYAFYLSSNRDEHIEVMYVSVDNSCGRIYRCGVMVPEY